MFTNLARSTRSQVATEGRSRRLASALATGALVTGSLFSTVVLPAAAYADTTPAAAAAASLPVITQDVSPLSAFDAELIRLTNVKRAEAGLPALQEARGLDSLSSWWSNQEVAGATNGKLAHNPNGMTMVTSYGASKRQYWGENVIKWSPTTATAQEIFNAYWASPTHKANLLSKNFAFMGVGTATTAAGVSFNTINFTDVVDAGQTYDPKAAATPIGHYEAATLTGATVRLKGWALDPDITTAASQLKVTDTASDGTVVTKTATANVARTDVGTQYPKSGPSHGYDYSYVTAGRGAHNVCVTVIDQGTGFGNVDLGCLSYQVGDPVGAVEVATLSGNTLTLSGWAVDPDQPTAAATVTVTDKPTSGATVTTKLVADKPSPAAAAAVPGAGNNHGFSGTTTVTGAGVHTICATVTGVRNAAVSTALDCKTVTVAGAVKPVGAFDTISAPNPNTVAITGWAADPAAPTKASTITVKITNAAGTTVTKNIPAGQAYPTDVAAGLGKNHAFTTTLPLASDGANTVCVTAVSTTDAALTTDLGCKAVTVNWLSGWLDDATPKTDSSGRTILVRGWAVDRGALTAAASITITVTAPTGKVTSVTVKADKSRPDVAGAIPGAGDNHGYLNTIKVAAAGDYQICTSIVNPRDAAAGKDLRCVTVTVV
jgi:uncharacterized protein YkwD